MMGRIEEHKAELIKGGMDEFEAGVWAERMAGPFIPWSPETDWRAEAAKRRDEANAKYAAAALNDDETAE